MAVLLLVITTTQAVAETRWCTITGISGDVKFAYLPISKAARIQGVVIGTILFTPGEEGSDFQPISGPQMLARGAVEQLKTWTLITTTQGKARRKSLAIVDYRLLENGSPDEARPVTLKVEPGVLRITVEAVPVLISDPAFVVGRPQLRYLPSYFWMKVRRKFSHAG